MLTSELKKEIDEKWDSCWPLSKLRPIVILDLISYLFFYVKISGYILASENSENRPNTASLNSNEREQKAWSKFKNLDEQSMHLLFTGENGIIDLIKKYSKNSDYAVFLKGNLLIAPTPKLLSNSVGIIKISEEENENTKAEIFEYLLGKSELNGPYNSQAYLPENLSDLMVAIIQPDGEDLIFDPSIGNGNLLVKSARFISHKNGAINYIDSRRLTGVGSDGTNLRIGAMNMILHGIHNPEIKSLDVLSPSNLPTTKLPKVIIANLIFSFSENKMSVEGASIRETTRKEIFYLNFILKNTKPGTRIAVIVPDIILYNNGAEFLDIRKEIVDNYKMDAVISLDDKNSSQFYGTSILVFSREPSAITDKVWFYKMEFNKNNQEVGSNQPDEFADILNHFNNKESRGESKTGQGFYMDANDIRSKNYSLHYNEYYLFLTQGKNNHPDEVEVVVKRVSNNNFKNQLFFPKAEKIAVPKKSHAKKIIIISILSIVIIGAGYWSYFYFNLNKYFITPKKPAAVIIIKNDSANDSSAQTTSGNIINTSNNKGGNRGDSIANIKYTVVTPKAYFYSSPDTNSRRNLFIINLVHATLTPEKEQNGFVYVVYINKHGESTKGWLNIKDLKPLP
ncbi:MAG TPA: N-6 DNA methylase [Hanamia sp.]|nr:N-6 DNA methylase [Hanamia sp.]